MRRPSELELTIDWREAGWKSFLLPGAAGRLIAFCECTCRAVFTFTGAEMIGIAADEAERQRETLPRAVRRVSYRLIFYYTGAILSIGLNLSANDPILVNSLSLPNYPGAFITMIRRANISVLPDIVNIVMIIDVFAVANADIYVAVSSKATLSECQSRTLYALSGERHAPTFLRRQNKYGVPWVAVLGAALPGPFAYMGVRYTSSNVCRWGAQPLMLRFLASCRHQPPSLSYGELYV